MKERCEDASPCVPMASKLDAPTIVRQRHRIALKHSQSEGGNDDTHDDGATSSKCLSPLSPTLSETSSSSSSSPVPSSRKYIRKEKIGQGAQGSVYRCIEVATGREMAAKIIMTNELSPAELDAIKHEVKTIKRLPRHRHLVEYYKATEKKARQLSIYMEFVAGGSLSSRLRQHGALPLELAKKYTRQLCEALQHLHHNRIAHRDIKCANVFLSSTGDEIKLGDFGAFKEVGCASLVGGLKGTPHWMAPEVIRAEQQMSEDGWFKADIWSLGCALIEMLTGHSPWQQYSNPMTAMYQIVSSNNTPTIPANATDETASFLKLCLQRNPDDRASIEKLLKDSFVQLDDQQPDRGSGERTLKSRMNLAQGDSQALDIASRKKVQPQHSVASPGPLRKMTAAAKLTIAVETNQETQRVVHGAMPSTQESTEGGPRSTSHLRKPSINPKLKPIDLIRSPSNQERDTTKSESNGSSSDAHTLPRVATKPASGGQGSIAITPVRLRRISTAPAPVRDTDEILSTIPGVNKHKLPPLGVRPASSAASSSSR